LSGKSQRRMVSARPFFYHKISSFHLSPCALETSCERFLDTP
jgi:hypothetical protein